MSDSVSKKTCSVVPRYSDQLFLSIALFLSGFCGIAYEVLYSRILTNLLGDHFTVNASLLITFMFGLGIGTKVAYRMRGFLWAIECSIGCYAFLFVLLVPILDHTLSTSGYPHGMTSNILISLALLLLPALMVGVSLPLFASYLKEAASGHGSAFSLAYTVYNFGAAVTALVVEFFLLRKFGIQMTVQFMGGINLLIGLLLFLRGKQTTPGREKREAVQYSWNTKGALILLGVASAIFQLFSLKVAEFIFGPFNETFAMVLAITLLGIAVGALIERRFRFGLLAYLYINVVWLALLIPSFMFILDVYSTYYLDFREGAGTLWNIFILFLIMGGSSICFGAAIPAIIKEESDVARESGELLFISSMANVAGYLFMIFFLHSLFEYGELLLVVMALLSVSIFFLSATHRIPLIFFLSISLTTALLFSRTWKEEVLYFGHTAFRSPEYLQYEMSTYTKGQVFKKYDETFSINTVDGSDYFFINGYNSIELNSAAEYVVGVVSSIVSPKLEHGLVLGLGSGATAGTVSELFDKVDVVEINPIVIEKQYLMKEYSFDIASKTNVNIWENDGSIYIKSSKKKYDLIVNTVTTPLYFSSSKLYTRDFFKDVKKRLGEGGVYTTWLDHRVGEMGVQIIMKTLKSEFNYCWIGFLKDEYLLLICSEKPIHLKQEAKVLGNKKLSDYFISEHGRMLRTLRYAIISANGFDALPGTSTAQINTVDRPVLEFEIAESSEPDISFFMKNIRSRYTVNRMNRTVFTNTPLDLYDMSAYFLQSARGSSFSRHVTEWARKMDKMFPKKINDHMNDMYRDSVKKNPSPSGKIRMASWLSHVKKYSDAINILKEVLDETPDHYKIRFKIGKALYLGGRHRDAIESFKEELKRDPTDADAMYWIGRSFLKLYEYSDAVKWFERCLKLNRWFDDANYFAGIACMKDGNKVRALLFFEQELAVDPREQRAKKYVDST